MEEDYRQQSNLVVERPVFLNMKSQQGLCPVFEETMIDREIEYNVLVYEIY